MAFDLRRNVTFGVRDLSLRLSIERDGIHGRRRRGLTQVESVVRPAGVMAERPNRASTRYNRHPVYHSNYRASSDDQQVTTRLALAMAVSLINKKKRKGENG